MTISELETETHGGTDRRDFFAPGRNCWRVCDTRDLAVVRDGAAYFRALREAMIAARRQVLLVGWDFDLEIELLPGVERHQIEFSEARGRALVAVRPRAHHDLALRPLRHKPGDGPRELVGARGVDLVETVEQQQRAAPLGMRSQARAATSEA